MLLSLLVGFVPAIAEKTGEVINKPVEVVTSIARQILMLAIGMFLIYVGAISAAGLLIGGGLIIVGIALVVVAVWPWFKGGE